MNICFEGHCEYVFGCGDKYCKHIFMQSLLAKRHCPCMAQEVVFVFWGIAGMTVFSAYQWKPLAHYRQQLLRRVLTLDK